MFDHFHVQDHIELFSRCRKVLGGGMAIVDGQALRLGVNLRDRDVARGGISADNRRPQPRHRFRQQATTATDVQNTQAFEGVGCPQVAPILRCDLGGDIIQPARVHQMQRAELAIGIPPFRRHRLEFCHFGGVDRGLHRRRPSISVSVN